ncbi:MAG: SusC/RagA family TonB-linked outer membrane protein [Phycisphaerales bacterium]|nr:SusC/RagA family TonB-linked outer membrane protein [Phycisphaerales bacterium]
MIFFTRLFLLLLLFGFLTVQSLGQKDSRGTIITVVDIKGDPIEGVDVTTNSGTGTKIIYLGTSNSKGQVKIKNVFKKQANTQLVFTLLGYHTENIPVDSFTNDIPIITLQEETSYDNTVLVVGYGSQKKKTYSGSVTQLDATKYANIVTPSFDKELSGRVAGLQVANTSGDISQPARIFLRGVNSLNYGQGPLIVVDNVPVINGNYTNATPSGSGPNLNSNALADINPDDIASITVLKDGEATAIYGSRGSPGVILITTKRGQKGKAKITYNGFYGFSQTMKRYALLNNKEFVAISNEKFANAGMTPLARDTDTNTDWQKQIYSQNPFITTQDLSVSGGTDKTLYYFSLNYSNLYGTVKTNQNTSYRIKLSVDETFNKYIKIGNSATLSRQYDLGADNRPSSTGGASLTSLLLFPNVSPYSPYTQSGYNIGYQANPTATNKSTNLFYSYAPNLAGSSTLLNTLYLLENNKFSSDKYRIFDVAYLEVKPISDLTLRTQASVDYLTNQVIVGYNPYHGPGYSVNGDVSTENQNVTQLNSQSYLTYNHNFRGGNLLTIVGGYEVQWYKYQITGAEGSNILSDFFINNGIISNTAVNQYILGDLQEYSFQSLYARVNYSYKNRYNFEGSLRRDGQSSLAPKNRYAVFPGVGLSWVISEEAFWQKNRPLSSVIGSAKLRMSFAKTGQNFQGFPYLTTYGPSLYGGDNAIQPNNIGNASIKWEATNKWDVGLDLAFWNNRITLSTDWYYNQDNNLLLSIPTPYSAGIPNSSIFANSGSMYNRGFEFTLSAQLVEYKQFGWELNANLALNKNKVTSLYQQGNKNIDTIPYGNNRNIVGQPFNVIFGYRYAGVNTQTGNTMFYKADNSLVQYDIRTGNYYSITDKNDGSFANPTTPLGNQDRAVLGNTLPTWLGGFTNTFHYAGLSLEVMFSFSGGNKIYNQTKGILTTQSFLNNGKIILDRWTTPGQEANIPKLYYGRSQFPDINSFYVEDASFLRLQNIVLSYQFGPNVLTKLMRGVIHGLTIYAQGQNLWVFTPYSGLDPNSQGYLGVIGLDNVVSPPVRTFTFGVRAEL